MTTANHLQNEAAWLLGVGVKPLKVMAGPQPNPGPDEVVIKVAYVAINPSDWKFQEMAYLPVKFPHIIGSDVAGTVAQLGADVTRFRVGQRVIAYV